MNHFYYISRRKAAAGLIETFSAEERVKLANVNESLKGQPMAFHQSRHIDSGLIVG